MPLIGRDVRVPDPPTSCLIRVLKGKALVFKLSSPLKLRTRITLLVCSVIAVVLLVVHTIFVYQSTDLTKNSLEEKALAVAHTLSETPFVAAAIDVPEEQKALQDFVESIRKRNQLMYIVVMDMNAIRHTHPDPTKIGQRFQGGDEMRVLHGEDTMTEAMGSLGNSIRAMSPLYYHGQQVGAVAVGISTERVQARIAANLWFAYIALIFGGIVGAVGAYYLAHRIKAMMFGMEPNEIASLLEQRNAMLQSIREGVIAVNSVSEITIINDEAKRLLRQSSSLESLMHSEGRKHWAKLLHLEQVLETGVAQHDEELVFNGLSLLTSSVPIRVNGEITGAVVSFRDKTEVSQLVERLSGMSNYAEALRMQAHEFMNKLHVILGMVNIGAFEQLEHYIMGIAERYHSDVGALVRQIKDPVIAGFMLGKINRAGESGIQIKVTEDSYLPESLDSEQVHVLVTILGNLLENAIDALHGVPEPEITVALDYELGSLFCIVKDNGKGIADDVLPHIFEQGYSTKGSNRGLGLYLLKQSLAKYEHSSVECRNNPDQGASFIVSLPYSGKEEK